VESWIFPETGASATVLGAMCQLGLLLLMFCAGVQMRGLVERRSTATIASIAAFGMVLPFLAGPGAVSVLDLDGYKGPSAHGASFLLVFALAIAVSSIPVISRIMFDLGLLETRFARIVLSVAVIEDVVVYVLLALALGMAGASGGSAFGLVPLFGAFMAGIATANIGRRGAADARAAITDFSFAFFGPLLRARRARARPRSPVRAALLPRLPRLRLRRQVGQRLPPRPRRRRAAALGGQYRRRALLRGAGHARHRHLAHRRCLARPRRDRAARRRAVRRAAAGCRGRAVTSAYWSADSSPLRRPRTSNARPASAARAAPTSGSVREGPPAAALTPSRMRVARWRTTRLATRIAMTYVR
jgi:hypothetical protein